MNVPSISSKIKRLMASAKARNLEVRLMNYEYENLLGMGCMYCGKNVLEENGYCLDRINSKKGYTFSNVVCCCKRCNMAKGTMTFTEFIDWINKAYAHHKSVFDRIAETPGVPSTYKETKQMHKDNRKTGETFCIKVKKKKYQDETL